MESRGQITTHGGLNVAAGGVTSAGASLASCRPMYDRTTCTPVVLYASDCPALDGYIYRNTSVSTNNVWHVEGWVSVECELPGGGRLRGDVNFDGCH